jgi:geranylgeranyl reductase family protein
MQALPRPTPPSSCDVLVVGAGPAGSACARVLAQAGHGVLLVDQHDFPRDKVCGDGLIPDAHAALRRLGLHEAVMSRARWSRHVRCVGPKGRFVDVPGSLAVLPRRELDHLLLQGAQAAGARVWTPARFEGVLQDGDRVVGARLRSEDAVHEVSARWVVLATGAVPQALQAAGMCERRTPSGVALRGYLRHPGGAAALDRLEVVWHPRLSGGYGWIFPAPDGVFNIGAGVVGSHRVDDAGRAKKQDVNLRELLQAFCEVHPPARELVAGGEWVGEVKGAPLRCSLAGARWSRPGLLVTGEAAGSTYAFTGEGIGKALETGMLAADALRGAPRDDAIVCAGYDAALHALRPRFVMYERAQRVNAHPWLADFLIWRARRSPRLLRRMSGVLEETSNPGHLLTVKGVLRLFTE